MNISCALCATCNRERDAVTIVAGYAVCEPHRKAIMQEGQSDTIERVIDATSRGLW